VARHIQTIAGCDAQVNASAVVDVTNLAIRPDPLALVTSVPYLVPQGTTKMEQTTAASARLTR
jgi:hypothetical protein